MLWLFKYYSATTQNNVLTSAVESHWPRQQQMPALLRMGTGNPRCMHSHQFAQTALPEKCKTEVETSESIYRLFTEYFGDTANLKKMYI